MLGCISPHSILADAQELSLDQSFASRAGLAVSAVETVIMEMRVFNGFMCLYLPYFDVFGVVMGAFHRGARRNFLARCHAVTVKIAGTVPMLAMFYMLLIYKDISFFGEKAACSLAGSDGKIVYRLLIGSL